MSQNITCQCDIRVSQSEEPVGWGGLPGPVHRDHIQRRSETCDHILQQCVCPQWRTAQWEWNSESVTPWASLDERVNTVTASQTLVKHCRWQMSWFSSCWCLTKSVKVKESVSLSFWVYDSFQFRAADLCSAVLQTRCQSLELLESWNWYFPVRVQGSLDVSSLTVTCQSWTCDTPVKAGEWQLNAAWSLIDFSSNDSSHKSILTNVQGLDLKNILSCWC